MDTEKYIGRLLDNRYEILEVIGVGGMAVVYKARCHRLNRLVAIKILKDDLSQDVEFRRRFHAESQAVAMLSHPNIMSVYDVSTTDAADYIVMELIDGITLKQYMEKKGTLNWKETLHFAMQIGKALEHAHSRGIVHRDIKPHNIMVLKNGSVKVTDFGIARIMSKSNTLTKEALGSVHYISPEQAKGGRVDNRSDLYSLGVVMYEMMTGRPPYDGESPVAVAIQHINGGAAMPSTLNPNIPGGLEQIIMKVMAVEPAKRYPSATALLYDMEEFRKDPAILFDFNDTPVDDALRVTAASQQAEKAAAPRPRTTAERVAGARPAPQQNRPAPSQQPRPSQPAPQRPAAQPQRDAAAEAKRKAAARERREQEEKRTRIITMAVIACSAVAVVAIIIFLWMLLNGGMFGSSVVLKSVPTLVGQEYGLLDRNKYPDFEIVFGNYDYSDEYEAGFIMDQSPAAGSQVAEGSEIKVYVSQGPERGELPRMEDLSGTTEEAATKWLDNLDGDLTVLPKTEYHDTIPEGKVIRTEPAAGEALEYGQTVILWLSSGKEIIEEYVPSVVNRKYEDAVKALNDKGFMNVDKDEVESKEPIGTVVEQSVKNGTKLDVTQEIILKVSKGMEVPNVVGKSYTEAVSMLNEKGFFNISQITKDSEEVKDKVLNQSVTAGTVTDTSSSIELTVSLGIVKEIMPKVTGMSLDAAKKELDVCGFKNVTANEVESDQPKGTVVKQSVDANVDTDVTTQIVLDVSIGPKVKKTVTIELPADLTEAYQLTVIHQGETVVDMEIQPGTASISVDLLGRGTSTYEVYIDGIDYKTDKVDFNS